MKSVYVSYECEHPHALMMSLIDLHVFLRAKLADIYFAIIRASS